MTTTGTGNLAERLLRPRLFLVLRSRDDTSSGIRPRLAPLLTEHQNERGANTVADDCIWMYLYED